jgi:signal transduction histidine kinase
MCTAFLAITRLVHYRTLRIMRSAALLAAFAAAVALLAALARRWGWSTTSVVAGACVLTALTFIPVRRWLTGRAERGFLRDAYDTAGTVLQLCIDLCQAAPHEIGPLVVTHLSSVLDLSFALLLTAHDRQPWFHAHPHSAIPQALREAVAQRAQELFAVLAPADALVEKVQRLPILFLPVWDGREAPAVLCLGPKQSGDSYTPQDQALLGTLARHLAVVFANKRLRAQLDEQMAALHRLAEERELLAERVFSAAEEERRRLAGVLHDEAVQLGGDVVLRLNDLLAQPNLPLDSHMELAAAASLGHDLVVRLREVVADLYPPPLQMVGLLPALQALLRDIEHHNPLRCPLRNCQ